MGFQMSRNSENGNKSPEKKERLTKAIINIIKKLKTSTGSKREKYIKWFAMNSTLIKMNDGSSQN